MRYAVLNVLVQTRCSTTIYQQFAHFLLEEYKIPSGIPRCAALRLIAGVIGVINAGNPLGPGPAGNYLSSLINQAAAIFKAVCAPI